MKKSKILPILAVSIFSMSVLSGCGNSTKDNENNVSEQNIYAGQTISGMVVSIDDKNITINKADTNEEVTAELNDDISISMQLPQMQAPQQQGTASDAEPPEMPDNQENPPEKPDNQENPPEKPDNQEISVGDTVEITFDEEGNILSIVITSFNKMNNMPSDNMGGQGMQMQGGIDSYEAVVEYTADAEEDNKSYSSTGVDENAILVTNDANVVLNNIYVSRTSDESTGGDNSSFYGVGAAILNTDGALCISDSTIETSADGAAGVFAYGDGTVYVSDTDITTTGNTAGGIHAAGGGTLYAEKLNISTEGESSAAIRSDRGGGTMIVNGGNYTSNGIGSPAVYSTADIAINDATLIANGSEAVCIEGLNTLRLFDSDLSGNMSDNEQNDCTWNVILYQSMSGDSEIGNSTFEMSGGSITAQNGGMFYTTNTESTFILKNVDLTYSDDNPFLLRCTGNNNQRGWGSVGENGADCKFTAISQSMEGDIIWDSISKLQFYMTSESKLTGAITDDESFAGDGGDGYCNVYIDSTSTWTVTGDSVLTGLYCEGSIKDADGNTVTIKGTDGTIYSRGTGRYTITVEEYSTTADMKNISNVSCWDDYKVDM